MVLVILLPLKGKRSPAAAAPFPGGSASERPGGPGAPARDTPTAPAATTTQNDKKLS